MRTILAVLLLAFALDARAAPPVYEVMSLVGDGLLIVQHRSSTGTSLERNERQFVPMHDPVIDRTALLAVDDAIRRADPAARPLLLGGHDPALLDAQTRMLEGSGTLQQIVDTLRPRLPKTGATRLILVVKTRHAASIRMGGDMHVGSGSLEGLGFYLDPGLPTARADTGEADYGLLAPFAYFELAMVDLASGKVVSEHPVYATASISAARSNTLSAWDAMDNGRKMRAVEGLLREEVADAMPELLASPH